MITNITNITNVADSTHVQGGPWPASAYLKHQPHRLNMNPDSCSFLYAQGPLIGV